MLFTEKINLMYNNYGKAKVKAIINQKQVSHLFPKLV